MTPKQQRFVQEYLLDLNATQAAIRAGYSERTAYSVGHENLKKPEIAKAVGAAQAKAAETAELTLVDHLKQLKEIRDKATAAKQYAAATNAEIHRGKASGLYIERQKLELVDNVVTDEPLTEDEWEKEYDNLGTAARTSDSTH